MECADEDAEVGLSSYSAQIQWGLRICIAKGFLGALAAGLWSALHAPFILLQWNFFDPSHG